MSEQEEVACPILFASDFGFPAAVLFDLGFVSVFIYLGNKENLVWLSVFKT